jgi:hypothetical protein
MIAKQVDNFRKQAVELAMSDPESEEHSFALAMTHIAVALPRNNLRCFVSTLDEAKDFDLLCIEVETVRAIHAVESLRIRRQALLEGKPWWHSDTQKPMVNEANRCWDEYRKLVQTLAHRPARTGAQAERKRRIIGRAWLRAEGAWYDRLRAGVAADETWLAEHFPKRARKKTAG